jgi:hypothetical protein
MVFRIISKCTVSRQELWKKGDKVGSGQVKILANHPDGPAGHANGLTDRKKRAGEKNTLLKWLEQD